ncbi:MAG: phosphoglycerate kinase [Gammaproteobacteria bacterium CG11_big_fil_rev_8_21_14_0_20_46_22]|nr:MAG: phosphoglycerate kinase [Gammaproteobacteria bacterium CG12_big_fil_rev_8_21_14_0_65_46_12]PIR10963.1 MAG: phosphoglycerate kinase [Gammaproteobacteria bacterium CG11_big_fil_rev_8_21_14_0_20_46_22]
MLTLADVDIKHKRVLLREDLNVPMKDGQIVSDARIKAALPAIKTAIKANARVMVMSHLGRPAEGATPDEFSLAPVAVRLGELLGQEVRLIQDYLDKPFDLGEGEVVLFENVRFNYGERANDAELSQKLANLCDVFVMDAFATAHRVEASTVGVAKFASVACAGPLLTKEIEALKKVLHEPKRPLIAVVGGSKVSTKLKLLESLADKVDTLIVGGGIANTFLAAEGYDIGDSLYEEELLDAAETVKEKMMARNAKLPLPTDVVVAEKMRNDAEAFEESIGQIGEGEKIFDVGSDTAKTYAGLMKEAGTILWNGPVGAFEIDQFSFGTECLAKAIAGSKAYSVAGGGDTLVAIEKYDIADKIDYISTGGGAFLAFIEAGTLPAIEALNAKA